MNWLIKNNHYYTESFEYKTIDINDLPEPIIFDNSEPMESQDNNIEFQEEFTVVFPDNSLDTVIGGLGTVTEFKKVVQKSNIKY